MPFRILFVDEGAAFELVRTGVQYVLANMTLRARETQKNPTRNNRLVEGRALGVFHTTFPINY